MKTWIAAFTELPKPIKITLAAGAIALTLAVIYFSVLDSYRQAKIERFEAESRQAQERAIGFEAKANAALKTADAEKQRADSLATQLAAIDTIAIKQDAAIRKTQANSSGLRHDLDRVRRDAPRRISTDELEKRFADRYGDR